MDYDRTIYVNGDDDAVNELGWYDENDEFIFYTPQEREEMELAELMEKGERRQRREEKKRMKRLAEIKEKAEKGDTKYIEILARIEKGREREEYK